MSLVPIRQGYNKISSAIPEGDEVIASHLVVYKPHWWSRKRKKIVITTRTAMYEVKGIDR